MLTRRFEMVFLQAFPPKLFDPIEPRGKEQRIERRSNGSERTPQLIQIMDVAERVLEFL